MNPQGLMQKNIKFKSWPETPLLFLTLNGSEKIFDAWTAHQNTDVTKALAHCDEFK